MRELLKLSENGLYCAKGDFYIDPWRPVGYAVITHAHSDHARWGSRYYLASAESHHVLRMRLGPDARIDSIPYGETVRRNGVSISLHPAGHIVGSAQIRIEYKDEVWVVTGDYKVEPDPTCTPFELVPCHTFVTESTFGLPVYHWPEQSSVFEQINRWWRNNAEVAKTSVLFGYSLGKAQRLLAGVNPEIGRIYVHGAVERMNRAYRQSGKPLPDAEYAGTGSDRKNYSGSLVIAPPSANGTPWLRKFGDVSTGLASGWMRIRGTRRRRAVDRGFVLSDHVDWPALIHTIKETGAERVYATHGYADVVTRWLRENGYDADAMHSRFEGELDEERGNE